MRPKPPWWRASTFSACGTWPKWSRCSTRPQDFTPARRATPRAARSAESTAPDFRDVRGQATRQARARSGGGRRPQRADDRPAGIGQDDAGETPRRHSAAADVSKKRSRPRRSTASPALLPKGAGLLHAAPVPLAAPHHLRRRPDRRRLGHAASRRGQPGAQRRAVSRRASRSSRATCWRCCASRWRTVASRIARSNHDAVLPGEIHAGGGDESLPVRILRRYHARMPLHARA